jgi:hypothetical protein
MLDCTIMMLSSFYAHSEPAPVAGQRQANAVGLRVVDGAEELGHMTTQPTLATAEVRATAVSAAESL